MNNTIKSLSLIERPREKLMHYGVDKLTNEELLSILIRTGRKGKNALEISKDLVNKFGTNLLTSTINDLTSIKGIGKVKAIELVACFELGKRLLQNKTVNLIMTPENVWNSLELERKSKKEILTVFFLDIRNQEIGREVISVGTINENLIHPREVFEPAIKNLSSQIIIAHNHPSGVLTPSENDLVVTERLAEAGRILGIVLTDHVIVSRDGWFSLKENNLM